MPEHSATKRAPICPLMPLIAPGLSFSCLQCTPDSLPSNILEQLGSWVAQNSTLLEGEPAGHAVLCAVCVASPAAPGCMWQRSACLRGFSFWPCWPPCCHRQLRFATALRPSAGATRPGCVQVALSALLSSEEAAGLSANFAGMVEGMASGSLGGARTSVLAQLDGQAALVDSNNRQLARLDLEGSAAILPQVRAWCESALHAIPQSLAAAAAAVGVWTAHQLQ